MFCWWKIVWNRKLYGSNKKKKCCLWWKNLLYSYKGSLAVKPTRVCRLLSAGNLFKPSTEQCIMWNFFFLLIENLFEKHTASGERPADTDKAQTWLMTSSVSWYMDVSEYGGCTTDVYSFISLTKHKILLNSCHIQLRIKCLRPFLLPYLMKGIRLQVYDVSRLWYEWIW